MKNTHVRLLVALLAAFALGVTIGYLARGCNQPRARIEPATVEQLCMEQGWRKVLAGVDPEGDYYLTRRPDDTQGTLSTLPVIPKHVGRWDGVLLVSKTRPGSAYLTEADCPGHVWVWREHVVFGDADMLARFKASVTRSR